MVLVVADGGGNERIIDQDFVGLYASLGQEQGVEGAVGGTGERGGVDGVKDGEGRVGSRFHDGLGALQTPGLGAVACAHHAYQQGYDSEQGYPFHCRREIIRRWSS
ncbi:MAG: hypothetical protein J6L79_05745 [Muribaculaceae bacterium]|nr:hypothetical protein [Muribaculaceae bacterium]